MSENELTREIRAQAVDLKRRIAAERDAQSDQEIPPKIDPDKEPHLAELRRLADAAERMADAIERMIAPKGGWP